METKVVKLDASKIDREKINEAAELIDAGKLVAFPTETVYGIACRAQSEALAKLNSIKARSPEKNYTLHIGIRTDVEKYVPAIGLKARKLIENAWPGPLTIVFALDSAGIDKQREKLEKEIFENLYKDNSIGIRCPDNNVASMLLQLTHNPVVAPSANVADQKPAVDAEQVLAQFSGKIELLLDAGPCKYKKSSTVVKLDKTGLQILRQGVYSPDELEAMTQVKILFVCTGNTCRSPMAEGLFRKFLVEKLGCNVDQLSKMGYIIHSAGVMDIFGSPAAPEAIAACQTKGVDIKNHQSRPLSRQLIEECDYIFAMSRMHCERVAALSDKAARKCVLLAENMEIPDPIGQSRQVYNDCAQMIENALQKRVGELVI